MKKKKASWPVSYLTYQSYKQGNYTSTKYICLELRMGKEKWGKKRLNRN